VFYLFFFRSVNLLIDSSWFGLSQRNITISTVGIPNTMSLFAKEVPQITLAISLHAPSQALREELVPSAKAYPLDKLLSDVSDYFAQTKRRITFE
jgi:23S rRNA (adenine2503-C2)-methyltransferase